MPQVIFEHSSNLKGIDYPGLFSEINSVIHRIPHSGTCKIRAVSQENYYIGSENGENAFAYLRVLLKPKQERTAAFRENLAKDLIPIIKKYVDTVQKTNGIKCYPTVEIGFLSEQYYSVDE